MQVQAHPSFRSRGWTNIARCYSNPVVKSKRWESEIRGVFRSTRIREPYCPDGRSRSPYDARTRTVGNAPLGAPRQGSFGCAFAPAIASLRASTPARSWPLGCLESSLFSGLLRSAATRRAHKETAHARACARARAASCSAWRPAGTAWPLRFARIACRSMFQRSGTSRLRSMRILVSSVWFAGHLDGSWGRSKARDHPDGPNDLSCRPLGRRRGRRTRSCRS